MKPMRSSWGIVKPSQPKRWSVFRGFWEFDNAVNHIRCVWSPDQVRIHQTQRDHVIRGHLNDVVRPHINLSRTERVQVRPHQTDWFQLVPPAQHIMIARFDGRCASFAPCERYCLRRRHLHKYVFYWWEALAPSTLWIHRKISQTQITFFMHTVTRNQVNETSARQNLQYKWTLFSLAW